MVFDDSLHIFGGTDWDGYAENVLRSSEIIKKDGTVTKSVNLPIELSDHAMVLVNDSVSLITSGNSNLESTWYYNHITQEFKKGPNMLRGRNSHEMGILIDHGTNQKIIAVAGGRRGYSSIDSTEFLIDGEWIQGLYDKDFYFLVNKIFQS